MKNGFQSYVCLPHNAKWEHGTQEKKDIEQRKMAQKSLMPYWLIWHDRSYHWQSRLSSTESKGLAPSMLRAFQALAWC